VNQLQTEKTNAEKEVDLALAELDVEIKQDLEKAAELQEVSVEEAWMLRDEEELQAEQEHRGRFEVLKRKREEFLNTGQSSKTNRREREKSTDSGDDDEEFDEDLLLDWRAQSIL
jgi:hypothetical protein